MVPMFVIHEDINQAKFAGDLALVKFNKTKHQLKCSVTATSSALRSVDAVALKVQFKAECKQVRFTLLGKFI